MRYKSDDDLRENIDPSVRRILEMYDLYITRDWYMVSNDGPSRPFYQFGTWGEPSVGIFPLFVGPQFDTPEELVEWTNEEGAARQIAEQLEETLYLHEEDRKELWSIVPD